MRILGGKYAGHSLKPNMKSWPTRPTTDMAKEALYNILMNRIDFQEVSMLDLFGGTGIHSIEFLSRGCPQVCYVDNYGPCIKWVKKKTEELGFSTGFNVYQTDVKKFVKNTTHTFDIIFADPPYALAWINQLPDMIFELDLINDRGMFILEHDQRNQFQDHIRFIEERKYGQTRFSFFK